MLKELFLGIVLLWTGTLAIMYFVMLSEKSQSPGTKNMNNEEVVGYGLLAVFFLVVDYFIIKRYIKKIKNQ
jgi:hypothetical protein